MAKEFRNIKMSPSIKENSAKLDITVDISEFINGGDLPISSTGNTYTIASTFGWHKMYDELDGMIIDIKVSTKKEHWDKKQAMIKQREQAKQALVELEKNKGAQDFFASMGVPKEMQGEMAGAFAAFMGQFLNQKQGN